MHQGLPSIGKTATAANRQMKTENEIQVVKFIDLHHLVCKYFKKFDALAGR